MCILDIKDLKKEKRRFIFYTIFCLIFSIIYESFSHGVISYYMLLSSIFPLIGLIEILFIIKQKLKIKVTSHNLFKSSILTFTFYFIIKGVLEIYGTTNSLVIIYLIIGFNLLLLNIFTYLKKD